MFEHGSQELINLLDKVIGPEAHQLSGQTALNVFAGFLFSGKARIKILNALYVVLKKELVTFNLEELLQASEVLSQLESFIPEFFPLVEPYLVHKLGSLTEQQLARLLPIYYSELFKVRYPILDQLEGTLVRQMPAMHDEIVLPLFYFYAKNRVASANVISAFLRRYAQAGDYAQLGGQQLVQLLVSVDMVGGDDTHKRQIL